VHVGDWVILGGFTVVHQFVRIGAHCMTAMCSLLFGRFAAFCDVPGSARSARSMNFEGLRRRGWTPERISGVKAMHKALYREDLTLEQACAHDRRSGLELAETAVDVAMMLLFLDRLPRNAASCAKGHALQRCPKCGPGAATQALNVAMVAGEASGDLLAGLVARRFA
jgi:acyl-[acyl carrier protein]--UDP-N-acetylglucosamine O-acyltransferase